MAHILELSDGSTTVSFVGSSGTSWCLIEDGGLIIETPQVSLARTGGYIGYAGSSAAGISYDNRRIRIIFEVVGDDRDDIVDKLIVIGRLIRQAINAEMRPSDIGKVFLKYQIDTLTNPVYFDVVYGILKLPDNIMSVEALNWVTTGDQDTIKGFSLELECKPFARGAEVLVGSGTINNTNDSYYDNYIAIAGSAINGDIPGPARIKLEGNSSDSGVRNPVWVAAKPYYNSAFVMEWEAENMDYATFGGSLTSKSTAYSGGTDATGGYAVEFSISSSVEVNLLRKALGIGQALYGKGKVRVFALGSFSNECTYRMANTNPDGVSFTYYEAHRPAQDYHATNNYIFDLGVIERVPSDFAYGETPTGNYVYLTALPDDSGTKNVRVDALMMLPAEDYCYRKLELMGTNGPSTSGSFIEDNGIRDWVRFGYTSSIFQSGIGTGLPIHLEPGVATTVYFLVEVAGLYVPSKASPVYIYHTPYYLNIRGTE